MKHLLIPALLAKITTMFESVRSTSTTAQDHQPLRLDLQFFADPPADPKDPPADPPDGDDDELTLADLLKTNPKIKAEYKTRVEAAVNKRFKNFDFDPDEAREALREKKERAEKGEDDKTLVDQRIVNLQKDKGTLEEKLKEKAVALYAAENGLNAKLMTRLAKDEIDKLSFANGYELDTEELDDLADSLREEFPDVFTVAEVTDPDDTGDTPPPPAPKRKGGFNPGTGKLNNPTDKEYDAKADMAERLERLNKNKRI